MFLIYSQELADSEKLQEKASQSLGLTQEPLPIVSVINSAKLCSCPECLVEKSTKPQSGMTSQPCLAKTFQGWTSSSEDGPVRETALRVLEKAWQTSEVGLSQKSSDLSRSYDPQLSSWKTSQESSRPQGMASATSLEKWPACGMMLDGKAYELPNLGPPIIELDSGFWPTPSASEGPKVTGYERQDSITKRVRLGWKSWEPPIPFVSRRKGKNALQDQGKEQNGKSILENFPRLNPLFTEVLLGYNPGVTELKPWAIAWTTSVRKKRSKSY